MTEHADQFALLRQRRFAPMFWTQFLGAANDNLFKFALTILVTYQLHVSWLPPSHAGIAIGALFILPFLLFSATSGQLSDKYDKTRVIRAVKLGEIAIMALAAWGFLSQQVPTLLACIFLMGLHSTLFGPVKYAYLPQHLSDRELTGGNGLFEMGTFVAILLGNVAGGLLVSIPQAGTTWVSGACLAVALLGLACGWRVPPSPPADPALRINWNPLTETLRNIRLAHRDAAMFHSMLGISWMWFFGAVFLSMFPAFARDVLHGDERVASLLLVVFSIGVGIGSLMCERLSRRQVEIGLVPIGALGMTLFAVDLHFASRGLEPAPGAGPDALWALGAFITQAAHWRVLFDLTMLAGSAGLYSVPMYALVQWRAPATHRARIIAAINILNALFMIASAVFAAALLAAGASVTGVFLATGLLSAVVTAALFWLRPEYLLRFAAWVASSLIQRLHLRGAEHIPMQGAAIIACNHSRAIDAILLMTASPRPIRFLVDERMLAGSMPGSLLRMAGAIAMKSSEAPEPGEPGSPKEHTTQEHAPRDPARCNEQALATAATILAEGGLICVFPEGRPSPDGHRRPLRDEVMTLLAKCPVTVVPAALSYPSSRRADLRMGPPIEATSVTIERLRRDITALLATH